MDFMVAASLLHNSGAGQHGRHGASRQTPSGKVRRLIIFSMCCAPASAASMLQPTEAVVAAQLRSLQRGPEGLRSAHALMSPAYHQRPDALERFSAWFNSPLFESLLGCTNWELRGCVTTREAACETLLPDGRTFLGTQAVEQMVQVDVMKLVIQVVIVPAIFGYDKRKAHLEETHHL